MLWRQLFVATIFFLTDWPHKIEACARPFGGQQMLVTKVAWQQNFLNKFLTNFWWKCCDSSMAFCNMEAPQLDGK